MIAYLFKKYPLWKIGQRNSILSNKLLLTKRNNFSDKEKNLNNINSPFLLNTRNHPFGKGKRKMNSSLSPKQSLLLFQIVLKRSNDLSHIFYLVLNV